MRRFYPPYGIQGDPRQDVGIRTMLAFLWADAKIQLLTITLVAMGAFIVGLVAGHNCASTYVEMTGGLPR